MKAPARSLALGARQKEQCKDTNCGQHRNCGVQETYVPRPQRLESNQNNSQHRFLMLLGESYHGAVGGEFKKWQTFRVWWCALSSNVPVITGRRVVAVMSIEIKFAWKY